MAEAYVAKEGAYGAEYEHLERIIDRVISEKPKDAYSLVEVLSRLVREQPDAAIPTATEDLEGAMEYVQKIRVLDKVPADGDPPAPVNVGSEVPDFCEDAEVLQWAGVGFGEMESYKIKCALRNLAFKQQENGYTRIRLWGKVLGSDADYYVAEAFKEGDMGEADEENPDAEPSGVGANKYTYLVTNDLASQEWTKLPNTKPKEVVAARRIKKLMTGKTTAKVVTHPPFPGTEDVLLRAQIARISSDVTLMFRDKLKREGTFGEEDAGEPAPNEEFVMPSSSSQLSAMQGWQHSEPHILQNGRTTHRDPPEADEDNPDNPDNKVRKRMLAEQESDPVRDPIRQLDGDRLDWVFKQYGDTALYKSASPTGQPRSNAVTCVRSLTWPGAVTVAQGSNMIQLYVGHGLAAREPDFFPSMLPNVQDEPEDPDEQPEPQGSVQVEEPPADDA
jgi:radial spoke head protein 4A